MGQDPTIRPGLRTLGVLGGVGSGKSTAARALAEGVPATLFDADAAVGRLLAAAQTAEAVEAALGPGLREESGRLSRKALSDRVFDDPAARARLESILHPQVRQALYGTLEQAESETRARWVVLDVPLLAEGGLDAVCDFLVFVHVDDELRAGRAMQRHGWSHEEWQRRERAQESLQEKRLLSDAILDNGGSLEHLARQVADLAAIIRELPPKRLIERWPAWNEAPTRKHP